MLHQRVLAIREQEVDPKRKRQQKHHKFYYNFAVSLEATLKLLEQLFCCSNLCWMVQSSIKMSCFILQTD